MISAAIIGADSKVRRCIELETLDQLLAELDAAGHPLILTRLTDLDFSKPYDRMEALAAVGIQAGDLQIMIYDDYIE